MREDIPSGTAALVSFGRGVGVRGDAPDPYARALCPPPFEPVLRVLDGAGPLYEPLRLGVRVATLGMVDHVTLRTSAIDRAVGAALASGVKQLVLLGAGLDARGLRMRGLEGVRVFEVDHPATQRFKRRRIEGQTAEVGAGDIVFVAVNFGRDSLKERLVEAGFDAGQATAWIWEGVTMYLPEVAMLETLSAVGELSSKGSRVMVTYMIPNSIPFGPIGSRLIRAVFEVGGEGLRDGYTPAQMAGHLEAHGFALLSDSSPVEWAEDAGYASWMTKLFRGEHLAVGIR